MALLHFRLEGNYTDTGELPTPHIIKDYVSTYLSNQNSSALNIQNLALDLEFNLKRRENLKWVREISNVCSFYGLDKRYCIENLRLRNQHYENDEYYCFCIFVLNGNYFALEFKMNENYFSDSDSIYIEMDI